MRPDYASYKPARLDSRAAEARFDIMNARHLREMTAPRLAAIYHLKPATAEQILKYEKARRGEG